MKKLLESIDALEGPMGMPPSLPAPEMDKGNPVTMSVSLNASGKDHVADLLDMMKNAGMSAAEPVSAKMLSPRMDMERLASIVGEPQDEPEMEEVEDEIEVEDELEAEVEDEVEAEIEEKEAITENQADSFEFLLSLMSDYKRASSVADLEAYKQALLNF